MRKSTVSNLWRPLDADVIANPYPFYKQLQKEHPVFQAQTGEWIITRYADIKNILGDKNRFKAGNRLQWMKHATSYAKEKGLDYSNIPKALQSFVLFKNPPQHTEYRKWIHQNWEEHPFIPGEIFGVIEELFNNANLSGFDFVSAIAKPLPLIAISKILGISLEDSPQLKSWSYDVIKAMDLYLKVSDLQRINKAAFHLLHYFTEIAEHPEVLDKSGIIYKLISDNTLNLTYEQLASAFIFLFIAGQETSAAFLSTMMYHLGNEQNFFNEVASGLASANASVNELFRFDPPVQLLGRINTEEVEINDIKIRPESTFTLCIAAGNRDPEIYENPEKIILTRSENPSLAFGYGIHRCLGESMAIDIAESALNYVSSHFHEIKISDNLEWENNISIRRLKSLEVSIWQ